MNRTAFGLAIAGSAVLAISTGAVAAPATVQFPAADGFTLTATMWQQDPGDPGILLLHQCNGDRSMYASLGDKLAAAGFRVLAPDYRGFGDSTGKGFEPSDRDSEGYWDRVSEALPADSAGAFQYLKQQGSGPIVAAVGASCGGKQVVELAGEHREIQLLVLFSARLDALAERDALRLEGPRMLCVYAEDDLRARRPAATINYRSRAADLIILPGAGHGYPLFAENPDLEDRIVTWLREGLAARE